MKKIIVNISLVFAFIFGMFFIGAGDVAAKDCSCFYETDVDNGKYYYTLHFSETKTEIAGKSTSTENVSVDGTLSTGISVLTRGEPFKINSKNIVSQKITKNDKGETFCSKQACESAKVRVKKDENGKIYPAILVACDSNCSKNKKLCGGVCTDDEKKVWKQSQALTVTSQNVYSSVGTGENADGNVVKDPTTNSGNTSSVKLTPDVSEIIKWGKKNGSSSLYKKNSLNACNVIDGDLKDKINEVLTLICVISIILLIIMSMIEFVKAVTGANEDLIKTAFKHTIIRIVCVVILFLLPILVSSVIDLVNKANGPQTDANGNYIIGEDGNPLCGVGE